MRTRLTERQNQVYEYIRSYVRKHSKPPTLKEIGRGLAIRSTNGVHKLVAALEKKGYITKTPNEARGIALVDTDPDAYAFDEGPPSLPLISRTRSDAPERLRLRPAGFLYTDPRLLDRTDPDECLIARAGDDGMNGDGIRKGDFLVVEETDWQGLRNGTLVAVLFDETLVVRRFDHANGRLHFRPADRTYNEEAFAPDSPDCYVVGRVRAVMRKL
ncbi:MAG: LexA family transcriptional regulator [Rhodothermaceae bacterium]|nr:LexA family transcriptional regulator [Rhodothermaceae bacterium]